MKKIIIIIICFLFLFLVSCSKDESVYVINIPNGIDNISLNSKVYKNIWGDKIINNDAPETYQTSFNGATYSGTYYYSRYEKRNSYMTNYYKFDQMMMFGIKDGTDELVYLNLLNKDFFNEEPFKDDITNPEEYTLSYAKEIASMFVSLDQYELFDEGTSTKERTSVKEEVEYSFTYYKYTFCKKIKELYTSDFITVVLTSKGSLVSLNIGDLNAFDNFDSITFDIELINSNIRNKAKSIYESYGYIFVDCNNLVSERLSISPDGKLCIYSYNSVTFIDKANETIGEAIELVAFIE